MNNSWGKQEVKLKWNLENSVSLGNLISFDKFPGIKEKSHEWQGYVHVQESAEKALNSHFWLTLGALHKQEVKADVELSTSWPSVEAVPQHTYRLSKMREISIASIKEIFVQLLVYH